MDVHPLQDGQPLSLLDALMDARVLDGTSCSLDDKPPQSHPTSVVMDAHLLQDGQPLSLHDLIHLKCEGPLVCALACVEQDAVGVHVGLQVVVT
eukprot:1136707-Pelagomonas_calceolata.AAC.4